jgi:hypothetical protein
MLDLIIAISCLEGDEDSTLPFIPDHFSTGDLYDHP